jgi:hypothetical protein
VTDSLTSVGETAINVSLYLSRLGRGIAFTESLQCADLGPIRLVVSCVCLPHIALHAPIITTSVIHRQGSKLRIKEVSA